MTLQSTAPAPVPPTPPGRTRIARRPTRAGLLQGMPILVLITLVLAVSAANPSFLEQRSLFTAADSSAALMILALGAMVVILCGGIDLSIAALASLCSVLVAQWLPTLGIWTVPAVVIVGALAGMAQGLIHVIAQIPSFVVTLGGMALWSGLALTFSGAATIAITSTELDWAFTRVGSAQIPSAVIVALIVVGICGAAISLTPLRRWLHAVGTSEPAAILAGVPVARVKVAAFAFSGACAGFASVLLVARTYSGSPTLADSLLLPVVAAVVVGGTAITGGHGGVARTVIGVLIIAVLRVGLSVAGVDSSYEQIIYGVLVIGAVALTIDRSKLTIIK